LINENKMLQRRWRKGYLLMFILIITVLLDQITKLYTHFNFKLGESVIVINNYFSFTYIRNKGAAFGFLGESNEVFRKLFFLILTPVAVIYILMLIRKTSNLRAYKIAAFSFILSGAIGNYINRLHLGYVVDFIDIHWAETYHWPAFNIADIAIVFGVICLILMDFRKEHFLHRSK